jgi:hypothetical protein
MQGEQLLQDPDFAQTLAKSPFKPQDLPGLSTTIASTFERLTPEQKVEMKKGIEQLEQLPAEELTAINRLLDYVAKNPDQYPALIKELSTSGAFDPEDVPKKYDPRFIAIVKSIVGFVISKKQGTPGYAKGGIANLKDAAGEVRSAGREGDTMLAHISPFEAEMLKRMGGRGTVNPETGLPEFGWFKSIIGAIIGIAATAILGPGGLALMSPLLAGAVGGGLSSLVMGGKPADVLKGALMGGITSGLVAGFTGTGGFVDNMLSSAPTAGGLARDLFGIKPVEGGISGLFGGSSMAGTAASSVAEGAAGATGADINALNTGADKIMGTAGNSTVTTPEGGLNLADKGISPTTIPVTAGAGAGASSSGGLSSLKGLWNDYKVPLMIGGAGALLMASKEEKEADVIKPSLIDKVNAADPNANIISPLDLGGVKKSAAPPSVFPGGQYVETPIFPKGGYISPTMPKEPPPPQFTGYDYTKIQFPMYGGQATSAAVGGAIDGPGTGTSDSIPAKLSDGEFVMTARAVRGAGNGDRAKGAKKMYGIMHKFERMA